ncbi:hypothetical protein B841_00240 [Corynebacterium maris DSM 45190]|uniref:M23ase beta-sheet core domain-containing protein n=1 Tax=Corynebacterium maris DSM 45190 TaxID=1224163 RepID=S5TF48_9CORY|nr:M23 family metallopeptidase [Corynebacterium maris]AGS33531.1 hypothetical protein B841_00240 [Corynebacterium maris DSM 45190]
MRIQTQRSAGTGHRKVSTRSPKRRLALVAATAGAVSTAGVGGATAATLTDGPAASSEVADVDYNLVNEAAALSSDGAPQILAIAEHKPTAGLADQLNKAVDYASEALAAAQAEQDLAAAAASMSSQGGANPVAYAAAAASPQSNASVVRPAEGTFTSGYGPRWGTLHAGIDIAAPIGTPIYSVMDGTVINSGPASGYGQWIRVKHDDGSMAVYGHMSTLNVGVGERVHAGQHIAGMGSEGHSTGSHLHFEIHPTGNGAVDPVPWFALHGIHF